MLVSIAPDAELNYTKQFSKSDHPHQRFVRKETPDSMKDLMYAVIATGGKQEKVEAGQVLNVELLHADEGSEVSFSPILLVDDETVMSTTDELAGSSVTARVVGEVKGEKIRGFTYKNKTNNRRRWGHRQRYTTIEITGIARG
jgi:large subunit ribosomal protein L21